MISLWAHLQLFIQRACLPRRPGGRRPSVAARPGTPLGAGRGDCPFLSAFCRRKTRRSRPSSIHDDGGRGEHGYEPHSPNPPTPIPGKNPAKAWDPEKGREMGPGHARLGRIDVQKSSIASGEEDQATMIHSHPSLSLPFRRRGEGTAPHPPSHPRHRSPLAQMMPARRRPRPSFSDFRFQKCPRQN